MTYLPAERGLQPNTLVRTILDFWWFVVLSTFVGTCSADLRTQLKKKEKQRQAGITDHYVLASPHPDH